MIYLLLFAATAASTGKTILMKKIGVDSNGAADLIKQNAFSFFISALIPFFLTGFHFSKLYNISAYSIGMAVLFALSVIVTYLAQMKALALGNSASTMLIYSCGFLIPVIFGTVRYGETITALQFFGVILLIPALVCIINPKKEKTFSLKWLLFSLISMTGSGCTAILQKIHQHSKHSDEFLSLLIFEFIFAGTILTVISLCMRKKTDRPINKRKSLCSSAVNGFFVGVLNTLNLRLAGKLPAVIVFPIYNIGSLVLSGIILALLFKEKLSIKEKIGLLVGVMGITLIGIG